MPWPLRRPPDTSPPGRISAEAGRRRTFAVISHPDAGKSTLTEALALHARVLAPEGKPVIGRCACSLTRSARPRAVHDRRSSRDSAVVARQNMLTPPERQVVRRIAQVLSAAAGAPRTAIAVACARRQTSEASAAGHPHRPPEPPPEQRGDGRCGAGINAVPQKTIVPESSWPWSMRRRPRLERG